MVWARGDFSAWKDSTRLFLNASAVATRLVNYPLLVRLNASAIDFSAIGAGGRDLRFADKDGNLLSQEIESFNAAAKEAVVWVKVPVIDSLSATQYLVMYWNNPAATDVSNGGAVFDTADGYAGVYHLAEDPAKAPADTGTKKFFADATKNHNHGDDFVSSPRDTGAIGFGQDFDGVDDRIQIPSSASLQLRGPLALSIWCRAETLKPTADGDTLDALIRKGDDNPNSYQLAVKGGYLFLALDADDNSTIRSKQKLVPGKYYHVAATYEGKSAKLYINGDFDSEFIIPNAAGALTQDDKPLQIGGRNRNASQSSHDQWRGALDEAWISRLSHTPAYFKMAYENQQPGSTLVTFSAFPPTPKFIGPTEPLTSWPHTRKIFLNTSATGADVAGPVAGFPLLVRLTADLFDFSQAKADGTDIRFSDMAGNPLAHSIEHWDATGKTAEVWVMVPKVAGNSKAGFINFHWGLTGAPDIQNAAAVFDTGKGFAGVWHMNDGVAGRSGLAGFPDQTANHNDGMDYALPAAGAAVIGKGQSFAEPLDHIEVRSNPGLAMTSALTLSAWIKGTAWNAGTVSNNLIFRKGGSAPIAYDMSIKDGHLKLYLNEFDTLGVAGRSTLDTGKWIHVAATWSGGLVQLYVDGKADLAAPVSRPGPLPQDTLTLNLGSRSSGSTTYSDWFNGSIDEMQLSRVARSADWIKLAYENQKTSSRLTVHEGYESKVPPLDTPIVIVPITSKKIPWQYDTTLAAGAELTEKGSFRLANAGPGPIHVVMNPTGDTVAPGVTGAQALIRVTDVNGTKPAVTFALDTAISAGRSLFQLLPGSGTSGRIAYLGGAAIGQSLIGSGSWIFASDTVAPAIRVIDRGMNGADEGDSSWIRLRVDDNAASMNLDCAATGVQGSPGPSQIMRKVGAGDTLRFALLPAQGAAPVKISCTAWDGSRRTLFPRLPSIAYELARSLPDCRAPVSLKGAMAWNLVGFPVRAAHPLALADLAAASGSGRLCVAAWTQDPGDFTKGDYTLREGSDSLPLDTGVWVASAKETSLLPLGRVLSLPADPDQTFPIRLHRGWNPITGPSLAGLPWVVNKQDLPAYDQSQVKGLHAYTGDGRYADADTLEPWKGYFVHANVDTILYLTSRAASAPKSGAASAFASSSGAGSGAAPGAGAIQIVLEPVPAADGSVPAPIHLRLGAAGYAVDALAREDEPMPTAPGQGAFLAAARGGRGLRTDVIGFRAGGIHAWKIAWSAKPGGSAGTAPSPAFGNADAPEASARLNLTRVDLPEGMLLWASAPSWQSPRRLYLRQDVEISALEGDTLAVWAAPAAVWSPGDPIPGLAPIPARLSADLHWVRGAGELRVDLPKASGLIASVYSVEGRCAARLETGRLAPGRHVFGLPGTGAAKGILFVRLEFPGGAGFARMVLRALASAP